MLTLPKLPDKFTWRLLIALGVATALIGMMQGFVVDPKSLALGSAILVVMLGLAHVYTAHRPEPQFALPAVLVAYFVTNGMIFGSLSYFAQSFGRPLYDAEYAAFDPLVGFDWRAVQVWTVSHQLVAYVSYYVYRSSALHIFVVWAALGFTSQLRRLSIFLTGMVIATAVCIAAAGLWPAMGAYTYFHVEDQALGYLKGTGTGYLHVHDLTALRDGTMRAIDLSKLEGIVTFPSFHTIVAVMCGWALYHMRWIGKPLALYSLLVVWTTLPVGGHYLADIVSGAAIAVFAIWAATKLSTVAEPAAPERFWQTEPVAVLRAG